MPVFPPFHSLFLLLASCLLIVVSFPTLQFPLSEKVVWQATKPGSGRVGAICEIEGEKAINVLFSFFATDLGRNFNSDTRCFTLLPPAF